MKEKKKVRMIFLISIIIFSSLLVINNNFIQISQQEFQTPMPGTKSRLHTSIYDWDSQLTIGVGEMPLSLASGDVNNDGEIDIVVANNQSNTITILLWNITNGDWDVHNRSVGTGPRAVAVGDANNDGFTDIVTANSLSNNISILLWNSSRQNWTSQTLTVGDQPKAVAIGDVTNNGTNEIVVANYNDDNVSIFTWNIENSTWNPEITRSVGDGPYIVEIGDIYEEGSNAIITGNEGSGDVVILRWNETAQDWYQTVLAGFGNMPSALALGDANNDGQIELIKTSLLDNLMFLREWNHGTQVWDQLMKSFGNSSTIAVGDVNSDGQNDIVTTNYLDSNVNLFLWNNSVNDWNLTTRSVGSGPTAVIIDDVNNDGLAEIVTANSAANTVSILLWNTTRGGLGGSIWRSVSYRPAAVAAGDVNHDGEIDIVTANSNNNSVSIFTWNESLTDWNPEILLPVNVSPTALDIGDVNNDGVQDIVACSSAVGNPFTKNISILLWNKMANNWNPYITRNVVADYGVADLMIADVNNDGANDIAVVTPTISPFLYLLIWNKSIGDWNPVRGLAVGTLPTDVEVGDVNNDGFNDLVVAGNTTVPLVSQYSIRLWNSSKGDWDASITNTIYSGPPAFTPAITIGDANNDGLNDLVITNRAMNRVNISIWNDTVDTWNPPIPKEVASEPVSVEIGDVNNDGQEDIVASCLSGHVSVLSWNATIPNWEYHSDHGAGVYPRSVIIQDVTDDGMNDIIVVNPQASTISVVQYNRYPFILSKTQIQSNSVWVQDEDFGSFSINLTEYESDPDDNNANLQWYTSNLNSSLVTVSGELSANDVLTFQSVGNVSGTDNFWLRLRDSHNFLDMIQITVTINPINDDPVIQAKEELRNHAVWTQFATLKEFSIDLTAYESDVEDSGSNLDWFVSGLDSGIATVTGENSSNDILTFHTQGKGTDSFYLILIDSEGGTDFILITIKIKPNIGLILAIVIPLAACGAVISFYFLYWKKRAFPKKPPKRVKITKPTQ